MIAVPFLASSAHPMLLILKAVATENLYERSQQKHPNHP